MRKLITSIILLLCLLLPLHSAFIKEFTKSYDLDTLNTHIDATVVMDDISQTIKTSVILHCDSYEFIDDSFFIYIYLLDEDGFSYSSYGLSTRDMSYQDGVEIFYDETNYYQHAGSFNSIRTFPGSIANIEVSIPYLFQMEEMKNHQDKIEEDKQIYSIPPFLYGFWNFNGTRLFITDTILKVGNIKMGIRAQNKNNDVNPLEIRSFYSNKDIFIVYIYDRTTREILSFVLARTENKNLVDVYFNGKLFAKLERAYV